MTDQRGVTRKSTPDVGAYEYIPTTVTTVSPSSGTQGQCPITVVISGTNFTGATAVNFGTGITVSGFTVNSGTQITATICIDAAATTGVRDVSVTTTGGTGTMTGGFTVVQQMIGAGNSHCRHRQ